MFCVYRQDDNGQVFEIRHGIDQASAETLRDQLIERGHKQLYWIEPVANCLTRRKPQRPAITYTSAPSTPRVRTVVDVGTASLDGKVRRTQSPTCEVMPNQ